MTRAPQTYRRYGYLRTSTKRQKIRRQVDGLKSLCDKLLIEKGVSATAKQRPVFDRLMQKLQSGDTLVVWDLDRAFRSAIDALVTAKDLQTRSIGFQIVTMNIDTTTPQGLYAYTIWAAGCEYERALLIQRTRQGLAAAKKRGVKLGRKPKLTKKQILTIRQTLKANPSLTLTALAKQYGVSRQTIRRVLKY